MKKYLSLILFIGMMIQGFSQSAGSLKIDLPELLPPGPDAAALIKAGMGSVNYSTGAVAVNIPLYEVKLGSFKLPLSLSYSSQGTKVEEACSRVGSGWALNAGGVITRSVNGRPDEWAPRPAVPSDLFALTTANYAYYQNASNLDPTSSFDTQPDEFRFNINGQSGKFILDQNGKPVLISHANLKVQVIKGTADIQEIIITGTDGVQYHFGYGNAYEKTITVTNMKFKQGIKTSFFLNEIELVNGDKIYFNYSSIQTKVQSGLVETIAIASYSEPFPVGNSPCPTCPAQNSTLSQSVKNQEIEYQTGRLGSISTSNGQSITFNYEDRNDVSLDSRLKSIVINGQAQFLKYYTLDYYIKAAATTTANGRFFLTKLTEFDLVAADDQNISLREKHEHLFEYHSMTTAGGNLYSQDYWGFANGKTNSTAIPAINERPDINGADRSPNWQYAVRGVLKKITYPTGGTEEFTYGPNTIPLKEKVNTITTYSFDGQGRPGANYSTVAPLVYGYLEPVRNQTISVKLRTFMDPVSTPPDNTIKVLYFKITDLATGDTKMNDYVLGLSELTEEINVVAGHVYRFEMEVRGPEYIRARTTVTYDSAAQDIYEWVNKEVGGVRLQKITMTDSLAQKTTSKYYTYASLDSLSRSSGRGFLNVSYLSSASNVLFNNESYTICHSNIYQSNSAYNLFRFDNSHVYYKTIIESNDENFVNGGTEYVFYNPRIEGGGGLLVWGSHIPNLPFYTSPNYNGLVYQVRIFDKDKKIQSVKTNHYEMVSSGNPVVGVAAKENYTPYPPVYPLDPQEFQVFSVMSYQYYPYWIQLKSTVSAITDNYNRRLTDSTSYEFGDTANILVKTERTTDSKGQTIIRSFKYPTDLNGTSIYDLMITKNIKEPVIEESITRNGLEIGKKKVLFKDWFSNGRMIQPEFVQLKESPASTLENKIQYASYDASGNITQLSKVNDHTLTYLWDYKRSFVTAEIKNATLAEVAYTSFETDSTGNWAISSGTVINGSGATGTRSFSGTLTKSFTQPISCVVTLWSTNNSVTVNGATVASLLTKGSWKLFRWQLSNVSNLTITGTNMDEVRAHPVGAMITTYTYRPFIGVQSKCDPNNVITRFEYDAFNRLQHIRDADSNIIKKICYNYAGQQENCLINETPVWVPSGVTRCKPCPANSTYASNIKQQEEKDANPNSTTFNQIRWMDIGASTDCVVVSDWQSTGAPQCLTDANGYRTGVRRTIEKDMNPCSGSYNQLRNVDVTDTVACTLNAPNWQYTANTRCKPCPGNPIYITNILQKEQKDIRIHSSTYNQSRWIDSGVSSNCVPPPGWENTTTPVRCKKDGNNQNTGEQEQEQVGMNPCGTMYDQIRWVVIGTNTSACPLPCNTTTCPGPDKKCINGICQQGWKGYTSSLYKKVSINNEWVWKWECKYKYCFPDGSSSTATYTEYQDESCGAAGCLAL